MSWDRLGQWWIEELENDDAYEQVVTPLVLDLIDVVPGQGWLDIGSGDGRYLKTLTMLGAFAHGVEVSPFLAAIAIDNAPMVRARLPSLQFIRDDSYDGALCVLVLEHLEDHQTLFQELARVIRPGGVFVLVINHPIWTAPRSTPISDSDGEVLWRPGDYFSAGYSDERAGAELVRFHHRTFGALLNSASSCGWKLEQLVELPHHDLLGQEGIPRLLGVRWGR